MLPIVLDARNLGYRAQDVASLVEASDQPQPDHAEAVVAAAGVYCTALEPDDGGRNAEPDVSPQA